MKQIVLSAGIFILLICITACTPQTKSEHIPLVSGHRGANMIAPENTMASADSCIKYGIDYMECDVCISKDSVFYILHDSTLNRTTNGTGNIGLWMSNDIDTLDAGIWFGPEFAGQRVPRFADLLRKAKSSGLKITVDYRSGDLKKLLETIETENMTENCCFTFSNEEDAKAFRHIAPNIKTLQAYVNNPNDLNRIVKELHPNIIVLWIDMLTPQFIEKCHKLNLQVLALALGHGDKTVEHQKAVDLGVDILATDHPEKFVLKYKSQFSSNSLRIK